MRVGHTLLVALALTSLTACNSLRFSAENRKHLVNLAQDEVTCFAVEKLQGKMNHQPLYRRDGQNCSAVDPAKNGAGQYFADATCSQSLSFAPARFRDFCREVVPQPPNPVLGNPAHWPSYAQDWTLWPASRLPTGVVPLKGRAQPYMTRRLFKSVPVYDNRTASIDGSTHPVTAPRGHGLCQLEMRIYSRNPGQAGKPMLALHGGKWQYRGTGFVGTETEISEYTEHGFIVFVPVYRLVTSKDGNLECNGARWQDQVADVDDALRWVNEHGREFGAAPSKVALLGGSAGSHLAMHLVTHHPEQISRAVLFYSPVDFRDYLLQARASGNARPKGVDGFEKLLDADFSVISPDDPAILANSFPPMIAQHPSRYPPLYLLHGNADRLVPSRQSVRLCNALSGNPDAGPARDDGGDPAQGVYTRRYDCDARGSQLHLFVEAEHTLNTCVPEIQCPAGSKGSQRAIRDALRATATWLQEG